jgi:hypothetical protein
MALGFAAEFTAVVSDSSDTFLRVLWLVAVVRLF